MGVAWGFFSAGPCRYEQDVDAFAYFELTFGKTQADTYVFSMKQTEGGNYNTMEWVEKINVIGFPFAPTSVVAADGPKEFSYDVVSSTLTIKKPSLEMKDFDITIKM
jgi:hypothetical protein